MVTSKVPLRKPSPLSPRQTDVLLLLAALPEPWEHERIGLAFGLDGFSSRSVLVSLEKRGLARLAPRYPLEWGEAAEGWEVTSDGAEAAEGAVREARKVPYRPRHRLPQYRRPR